jgi:hypothetical protein
MAGYSYTITWPGPNGSKRTYHGTGFPTPDSAMRARIAKILTLAERFPKRRTVLVRAA